MSWVLHNVPLRLGWVAIPTLCYYNYSGAPVYYVVPSQCDLQFWSAGNVPPAFTSKFSSSNDGGHNWWIDGEVGWRIFFAKAANDPSNTVMEKQYGLCPSYYGNHDTTNCVRFIEGGNDYEESKTVFAAMDNSYNSTYYQVEYGIDSTAPFTENVSRASMHDALLDWIQTSTRTYDVVVLMFCLFFIQAGIMGLNKLAFGIMAFLHKVKSRVGEVKRRKQLVLLFFATYISSIWIPAILTLSASHKNLHADSFLDAVNWEALFPYCDVKVVTYREKPTPTGSSYVYGANWSDYIRGVAIFHTVFAAFWTVVTMKAAYDAEIESQRHDTSDEYFEKLRENKEILPYVRHFTGKSEDMLTKQGYYQPKEWTGHDILAMGYSKEESNAYVVMRKLSVGDMVAEVRKSGVDPPFRLGQVVEIHKKESEPGKHRNQIDAQWIERSAKFGEEATVEKGREHYTHEGDNASRTQKVELYRYVTNEHLVAEKKKFIEIKSFPEECEAAKEYFRDNFICIPLKKEKEEGYIPEGYSAEVRRGGDNGLSSVDVAYPV